MGVGLLMCAMVQPAWAQSPEFDGSLGYSARHSITNPQTGGTDNDQFVGTFGLSWSPMRGEAWRFGVISGVAVDEDLDRQTPLGGFELTRGWSLADRRSFLGGRLIWAEDQTTSLELAVGHERFSILGDWIDGRLMLGVQGLTNDNRVSKRDAASLFGLAELSVYPTDATAIRLSILGDSDGEVGALAVEQKLGSLPVSLYIEYAETQDSYRGFAGYNDLTVGFRYVPGRRDIKRDSRDSMARSMRRYVQVQ